MSVTYVNICFGMTVVLKKPNFCQLTYVTGVQVHVRILGREGALIPKVINVTFGVGSASIGGGAALRLNP